MSPSVTVRLLATQSDARLVELARGGHERAFEALVQRYRRPLLAYCRRVLLPEARAEDALQQALLRAWLALQRGAEVRDARAWLYRIVHNTALNALRGSGYDYAELSEALTGAGAPQEDLERRIAVREALAGLAALPEAQREALLRTAVEGASHADAATAMGVSEGAVRGLVHRARAALRTAVTAVTPMPLASWAAGAAGHGGAAVADLAVGGGAAGLAGLLAKGGAVVVTAGVLAAGVGTAERHRHDGGHAAARPAVRAARTDASTSGAAAAPRDATLIAVAAPAVPADTSGSTAGGTDRSRSGSHHSAAHRGRHAGGRRRRGARVAPLRAPRPGATSWDAPASARRERARRDDGREAGDAGPPPRVPSGSRGGDDGRPLRRRPALRDGGGRAAPRAPGPGPGPRAARPLRARPGGGDGPRVRPGGGLRGDGSGDGGTGGSQPGDGGQAGDGAGDGGSSGEDAARYINGSDSPR